LQHLRLVLVPRHPERFNAVANLCSSRGFIVARRSGKVVAQNTQIIVGDTMGELLLMFGTSDIAFVGGSLVPNGGHNFIEPAVWQLPILSGTSVFNFAEVARLLGDVGALTLVSSSVELAEQVELLAINNAERQRRGSIALQVANENRGALGKTLHALERFL